MVAPENTLGSWDTARRPAPAAAIRPFPLPTRLAPLPPHTEAPTCATAPAMGHADTHNPTIVRAHRRRGGSPHTERATCAATGPMRHTGEYAPLIVCAHCPRKADRNR
ncbi:hypothetical protein Aca07nite_13000 [Actinoplanes capillaceus]|uniref:Uncharacterized protein n=1 Tax=Actinoplanes campanulatus TaxID=113559 RepID=A0ABQ3WCC8_9ACTN|nr:hypothetical protein Aca07nite_13000 [Actinoplanes capillaceus]